MLTYDFNTQINNVDNNVTLDINLNKKFNFLSKSFLDLSSQNFNSIASNLDSIMISGSNYSSQIKGFIVERSYILNDNQGHDYFIEYLDSKENNNIKLSLQDNTETSRQRNVFSLQNLVNQNVNEITYDISYFEISSEEIIKSKTLLTDYLMRQYFYNQGKTYSLSKMEKIAESLQNTNALEEELDLNFYKAITKATSKNTTSLFKKSDPSIIKRIMLSGFYQNKSFLFKLETENYTNNTFDISSKKVYRHDTSNKTKLLISDNKYKKEEYPLSARGNSIFGYLLTKQKAKEYKRNTKFTYEIELTFNIYSNESNDYTTEKASIRL